MATLLLPLRSDSPHFDFQVELEGTTFGFELKWNSRDEAWYLTVRAADDTIVLAGLKLVVRHPLLSRYRRLGLPKGELEAVDTTGKDAEAGLNDLGVRVLLLYTPSTDFPAEYVLP